MAEKVDPIEFVLSMKNPPSNEAAAKAITESLQKIIENLFKIEKPLTVDGLGKVIEGAKGRLKAEENKTLNEVKKFYAEQIGAVAKAEEKADTPEEKRSFTSARLRLIVQEENEIRAIEEESNRKILEAEAKLIDRRIALSDKFYLFKSDKDRQSLEEQKKNTKEQLTSLKTSQSINNTKATALAIQEAEIKIRELDKSIGKLSSQKISEVLGYSAQIFKGLPSMFPNDASVSKLAEWGTGFAESATNMLSGDPSKMIDGAIKAVSTVVNMFSANSQANKEIAEFNRQLEVTAVKYSISVINAIKDIKGIGDSIFNKDINNSLEQGMAGYEQAIEKTKELSSQLDEVEVEVGKKKTRFLGVTTGTKKIMDDVASGYKKILATEEELIDGETGRIDKNMAKALIDSGKLSAEATDLITNIVAAQDAGDAALAQVEATLAGIAGSIGTDLRAALVDAFKSGQSEADAFKKSVSKILEDIVVQNLFTAVFGEMLKGLEENMKNSYKEGGDGSITDDIALFSQEYSGKVGEFNAGLGTIRDQLGEQGFDILSTQQPTATTGQGLASITQDSASELNGNFNNMLFQVDEIAKINGNALLVQQAMNTTLNTIAGHTAHLLSIDSSLEDIKIRGVKVKV